MPSPTQARLMFRSLSRHLSESHPFSRNPITMTPHSWRMGDLTKKLGRTSVVFIPFYAAFFGWPIAAAAYYNGRM